MAAALVDEHSSLSGEVIVAGGGQVGLASVASGAVRTLGDNADVGAALGELVAAGPNNSYAGAVAMFEDFVAQGAVA